MKGEYGREVKGNAFTDWVGWRNKIYNRFL